MTTSPGLLSSVRARGAEIRWLLVIVAVALAIRIYFPWPLVFAPGHVTLLETDAWYHLRVIENLVRNWPHRLRFDPYAGPGGDFVPAPPLLDFLVAGVAWLAGAGRPSPELTRLVTAFAPPVLGALTVAGVYAVARLAAGGLAGLLAAALAAILPGHFLDRTLLGFADHHALEACLSTAVLFAVAHAVTRSRSALWSGVWLGVGLAAYRLGWTSAAMLVAILIVWLAVHAILQSWRAGDVGNAARVALVAALVAMPWTWLFEGVEPFNASLHLLALTTLALVAAAVEAGRYGIRARWWSPRTVPLLAVGLAAVAIVTARLAFPWTVGAVLGALGRFHEGTQGQTVLEARPLFLFDGTWSLRPAWGFFRSGAILGLVGVTFLALRWLRQARPLDLLLIVWTAGMAAATIGQNRFGYYLVPAMAIVGGCACAWVIESGRRAGPRWSAAAAVSVAAVGFGLNLVPAIATTVREPDVPARWLPAFDWMRDHSPEPFGDPGYYTARYDVGVPRRASSTVMAWWDYGYVLMEVAHRVPISTPTQGGAGDAARFFTATDEAQALAVLDGYRARDVLVDDALPLNVDLTGETVGKFAAVSEWANRPEAGLYYDTFLFRDGRQYRPAVLFFAAYYQTMAYRLGVLGGQGTTPNGSTTVVSWTNEDVPGFGMSPVVSSLEVFPTYEEGVRRLEQLGAGTHTIVSRDPRASPVPLDPVRILRRVYRTPAAGRFGQGAAQVFELNP